MKSILKIIALLFITISTQAQNVGIGTTTPHSSAALDVSSTSKGLLTPRMTTAQRNAIATPQNGLLVFDTNRGSYWFYGDGGWKEMYSDAASNDSGLVIGQSTGALSGINQTVTSNVQLNDSAGYIYDSGGATGNYGNNENISVGYYSTKENVLGVRVMVVANDLENFYDSLVIEGLKIDKYELTTYKGSQTGTHTYNESVFIITFRSNNIVNFGGFTIKYEFIFPANTSNTSSPQNITGWNYYPSKMAMRGGFNLPQNIDSIGLFSFNYGNNNKALNKYSITMGERNIARGNHSTVIGSNSTASGGYSTAIGHYSKAEGGTSIAIGRSEASGFKSIALGDYTFARATNSVAIGNNTFASGEGSIALGSATASGSGSAALSGGIASGTGSTALGGGTASGTNSTAMGDGTRATGFRSTSFGTGTLASGVISTSLGFLTKASGDISTAMGTNTNARSISSLAIGQYNDSIITSNPTTWVVTDPAFIIGNGTSNAARSNAFTVFKNGNVLAAGTINSGAITSSSVVSAANVIIPK